jgi:translation initiation factor 2B subunit (eIF-2B alpha/beta/delta family)
MAPQQETAGERETAAADSTTAEQQTDEGKVRDGKRAAAALATALKGFAATLSQHTERQSNLIDVFGAAIRELGAELQKSKTKAFSLEVRLREAESRISQLEKIMGAWTRQGQGWVQ